MRPAVLRMMGVALAAFLFTLPLACPSASGGGPESQSPSMETALRQALEDGWRRLRLEAECLLPSGFHSLSVLGNGVSVWDKAIQFHSSPEVIRAQLNAFREHGFAGMQDSYGGKGEPRPLRQPPRISCTVILEIDGVRKEVRQFHLGEQSEELRRLAEGLFSIAQVPAESGVAADNLEDGLAKVAGGSLAPETLRILVNRRITGSVSGHEAGGWLFEIERRRATSRLYREGTGYEEPLGLGLEPEEVARLAGLLSELDASTLPINLFSDHYTDLSVEVLNHEKRIQARKFARLGPGSLGEKQQRFDRVLAELEALHRRVREEGTPNPE